jgi:hypothetical protein
MVRLRTRVSIPSIVSGVRLPLPLCVQMLALPPSQHSRFVAACAAPAIQCFEECDSIHYLFLEVLDLSAQRIPL